MLSHKMRGFTKGVEHEVKVGTKGKIPDLIISRSVFEAVTGMKLPDHIKEVVIDFTHEARKSSVFRDKRYYFEGKYYKEYQSKDRLLFVVLSHPSIDQGDIDVFTQRRRYKQAPEPQNIELITLEDFRAMFKFQDEINSRVDKLYELVANCLKRSDPTLTTKEVVDLRVKSLKELKEIYEQSKLIFKHPLSQIKLLQFKGSFFNLD